jgi:hypothetical protein
MAGLSWTLLLQISFRAHHSVMPKLLSIAAMALMLLSSSARAVEIENLYGGQAIVTGIFEPERTRGLRQVLLDVLIKVSAEPKLADDPRVQPLLDRAKDFVVSYDYEDRMKGTPVRDEQGTRDRPHDLRIKFDPAKIDAALAELGLKPWGSDRPILSANITIEYPNNSYSLTAHGPNGLGQREALLAAGDRRGVPIGLPAPSVISNTNLPPSMPTLKKAEQFTLSGTLRWQPDRSLWHTSWTLMQTLIDTSQTPPFTTKSRSWTTETTSFDEAFRNGVGEAAATLAGRR